LKTGKKLDGFLSGIAVGGRENQHLDTENSYPIIRHWEFQNEPQGLTLVMEILYVL
jgi:hypothetical protein